MSAPEAWAVAASHAGLVEQFARMPWSPKAAPGVGAQYLDNGVAVLTICGTLLKYGSGLFALPGMIDYRSELRRLARDEHVQKVVLVFDSPGGEVAGTDDFAEEVRAVAKRKPVVAYCEDLCASAAYWVASQCTSVYANRAARVGSIGVYSVVHDDSEAASKEGVRVHVVRSADFKGAGAPGTPVTDEQLADVQRLVDGTHQAFVGAVRRARPGVNTAAFDGRLYSAREAQRLGLIDDVRRLDTIILNAKPASASQSKPKQRAAVTHGATATHTEVQTMTATEQVETRIAAAVAAGQTRAEAIHALQKADPELIAQWCTEATAAAKAAKGGAR